MQTARLALFLGAALLVTSTAAAGSKNHDLEFQRFAAEFFAESEAHDAWASRELQKCRMRKDGARRRSCSERLQPEITRRRCALYTRTHERHVRLFGPGNSQWKPGPECRR